MNALDFNPRPLDQLDSPQGVAPEEWLWDGYLARGGITLLTSRWKSGKTTLLAGLLRALGGGGTFLGRPCAASAALVVSEESAAQWAERVRAVPVGPHTLLVSRPFTGRPSPSQWAELVGRAREVRAAGHLDLFVVDPLASFLPGRSDSDPATLLDLLHPLRALAETGVAVLVLHHPRKDAAEEGSAARGSGALLGYVDVILELHRSGTLAADATRRRLTGLSRRPQTPESLTYEWVPGTPEFRAVADVRSARFRENWAAVRALLEARARAVTHKELLADWPADQPPPSATTLYEWLTRAAAEGLVERTGNGTKTEPFRFRLPHDLHEMLTRLDPLPPRW
jgi:hypothetical protein